MKKLLFAVCLFGACQFGCIEKVIIGDNGQLPSCETSTSPCELPGEPNGLPTSGCDPIVKVTVIGPGEGQIAAGAKGALFARASVINACGPTTFKSLSVYLASEQLTKYCAATCTATDAWNFSRPMLVSGGTVFVAANGFHLAQMYDGTPALEATFDQPFSVAAGETVTLDFLVDVADVEAVPGSLFGRRFRATLGWAFINSSVVYSGVVADGGYQTITPAK